MKLKNDRERKIYSDGMSMGIFISALIFITLVMIAPI